LLIFFVFVVFFSVPVFFFGVVLGWGGDNYVGIK
jgi:hypothetical protein